MTTAPLFLSAAGSGRSPLGLLLLCVAAAGCAGRPARPAASGLFTVHEDHTLPGDRAAFERARLDWLAAVARAGGEDSRGFYLEVGDDALYSLAAIDDFAGIDARRARAGALLAEVPPEAGRLYDEQSDRLLVFPHRSEVWRQDDALGYAPAAGALTFREAGAGRIVFSAVKADLRSRTRWAELQESLVKLLAEARYPLTRTVFDCVYGAGEEVTLWLARDAARLRAAPTPEEAVAGRLGAAAAAALFHELRSLLVHSEERELVPRPDLSSPGARTLVPALTSPAAAP